MKATAKRKNFGGMALLIAPLMILAPLWGQDKQETPAAVEKKTDTKTETKPAPEAKPEAKPADAAMPAHPVAESTPASGITKAELIGASMCIGCHADREAFHNNIHAKAFPKAKGIEFEQSCETCHGPGSLHAGAGGDKSNPDFYTIRNPKKLKPAEVSQLCQQCHSGGQRMHWLGSAHEAKNVACVDCHGMHEVAANEGKAPLLKKATEAEVCYQCHAEKKAQIRKSAHMPIVEGKVGCSACHNPHGSTTDKLLVKNSVTETCYQCHQDKRGPFLWEHPPVREDCLNCHDPHGTSNDHLLVIKPPFLCDRCHQNGSMGIVQADPHSQSLPAAQGALSMGGSCMDCHPKIHGSNHPSGKRFNR